jgi:hypothetical protein
VSVLIWNWQRYSLAMLAHNKDGTDNRYPCLWITLGILICAASYYKLARMIYPCSPNCSSVGKLIPISVFLMAIFFCGDWIFMILLVFVLATKQTIGRDPSP